MFSVVFEVHPKTEQWDAYLGNAKMLRPELEQVDGFIDNIRYQSLTREGWILSLSGWRDEKSVVRWRTKMRHQQRLDETEVGAGTTITLIDAKQPPAPKPASPEDLARHLGLAAQAEGLLAWDAFDAVLTPGDLMLLISWKSNQAAQAFENSVKLPPDGRFRRVRVVRDYGMFDRREAPQYYPDAVRAPG
jgi:heme-degrading monooxygenase HmoA